MSISKLIREDSDTDKDWFQQAEFKRLFTEAVKPGKGYLKSVADNKKRDDERISILEQAQIESRRRQKSAVENSMLVEEMSKISIESDRIRRARKEGKPPRSSFRSFCGAHKEV